MKHTDPDKKLVTQNPDMVKTKFRKYIETYFFPVGEEVEQIVASGTWSLPNPLFSRVRGRYFWASETQISGVKKRMVGDMISIRPETRTPNMDRIRILASRISGFLGA